VNINNVVFWVMTPYNIQGRYQCFRRTYTASTLNYTLKMETLCSPETVSQYQTTRCNNRNIKLSVYASPHIDQAIKSARMIWASHVQELGETSIHIPNGVNLR
jgi:muramidase (phage lysozyme)